MAVTIKGATTIRGNTTVGFSPASLFAAGEQGVWLDPSDFSTMFQDTAGTTPVTAVEQPVGLIKDKSGRGNNATQFTSGNRPVLSARVNLLTKTEQFDFTGAADQIWTKVNATVPVTNATSPISTATGCQILETVTNGGHAFYGAVAAIANSAISLNLLIYAKASGRTKFRLSIWSGAGAVPGATNSGGADFDLSAVTAATVTNGSYVGNSATITAAGNGWYLCTANVMIPSASFQYFTATVSDGSSFSYAGDTGKGIYFWGADLRPTNQGVGLPAYQRVNTSTDYDTTGFPYYLKFDGSNDYMDFSALAVSNQTLIFGVQPTNPVTAASSSQAILCTISGEVSVISFGSTTASMSNERISWLRVASSVVYGCGQTSEDFAASPYVLTFTYATTPATAYSRNAVSKTLTNATAPGNGPFTAAIYPTNYARIGAREDATFFFGGRIYGLIIRGAASTSDQITATENWMNTKTRAY